MVTLSEKMDFYHVVRVLPDGTVEDTDILAPELDCWEDDDGNVHEQLYGHDWELLRGFTGQHSYNGPVMHPSEYIGGGLERHILSNPGLYVSLEAEVFGEHHNEPETYGWVVAFKSEEN